MIWVYFVHCHAEVEDSVLEWTVDVLRDEIKIADLCGRARHCVRAERCCSEWPRCGRFSLWDLGPGAVLLLWTAQPAPSSRTKRDAASVAAFESPAAPDGHGEARKIPGLRAHRWRFDVGVG